jgi:hypothetical protein
MNLELTPEQEQIVKDELKTGRFRNVEELISTALKTLRAEESSQRTIESPNVAQESAVEAMLAFIEQNRVRLEGVSVKDLIREGHRL